MDKPSSQRQVRNQTFTKSYRDDANVIVNPSIRISHVGYPLDKSEFTTLTNETTGCTSWATKILWISIGQWLQLLAKHIAIAFGKSSVTIATWEIILGVLGAVIAGALYAVDHKFPGERSRLIRKLKTYYEAPKTVESHREP